MILIWNLVVEVEDIQEQVAQLCIDGEGLDVFRFIDLDTELVEFEDGVAKNESVTVATRAAIEAAVVALIKQGDTRGYWKVAEGENNENDEGVNQWTICIKSI